jgi:two-component system phosphate regulon sensor histidine kinase PhoR
MKNKHLRHLILFGTLALAGLFVVQIYWFRKAFDVEARQFDHSVQIVLMRVADSVSHHAEVKKLSSNFYFVVTETNLSDEVLDTLLKEELRRRNILLDYELGIYNAGDDTLVYGQYVEATKKYLLDRNTLSHREAVADKNFAVYFPRKQSYVIAQLDVWIFSTLALLFMICFFAWAIATLLRERRFAEIKNDFINNMTHEFKTPVTNIGITGEIIRKKIPEGVDVHVYLDILIKENEKLRNKIEKVLLGSSLDHRKPRLERLDVNALITECAETFQLKVQERNGLLQLDLNARSPFILGDRELLSQAISNVIDNAEKYSVNNPHIVVKTRDTRIGIEIDVRDNGVGVPSTLRERVFEKFFRVQEGDVHNVKGFGLGLTFVKHVVKSHRGNVGLLSGLNEGTQVRIILPTA